MIRGGALTEEDVGDLSAPADDEGLERVCLVDQLPQELVGYPWDSRVWGLEFGVYG